MIGKTTTTLIIPGGKEVEVEHTETGNEINDTYRAVKAYKQQKRADNRQSSPQLLEANGIKFETKNMGAHLIIDHKTLGKVDFWPGTGLFHFRKSKARGRGVRNLIKRLKGHGGQNGTHKAKVSV